MLSIQFIPKPHYLLITAEGRLDALGSGTFEQEISKAYQMSHFWVLDCSRITFLSSAGIRSLIQAVKKLSADEGELVLLNPGDQIRQVLDMSGLLRQFNICTNINETENYIQGVLSRREGPRDFESEQRRYTFKALTTKGSAIMKWEKGYTEGKPLYCSLKEVGMAAGKGCLAENLYQAEEMNGAFISFPGFFYFSPDNENHPSDYFSGRTDAAHGVYISESFSVQGEPSYQVDINTRSETILSVVAGEICQMIGEREGNMPSMIYFTGITEDHRLVNGAYTNQKMLLDNQEISVFWKGTEKNHDSYLMAAATGSGNATLSPTLNDYQKVQNIIRSMDPGSERLVCNDDILVGKGRFWIYIPTEVTDARSSRLEIVYEDKIETPEVWELIIREIYNDSGKVILKQLHGGFSAKTFQVTAFDNSGRRLLPTVLKLGGTGIVEREEKNYRENVEKFILNNSTTIMGAHYSGDWGGVRYNFLGINGPETRLKWLTHIYRERSIEELVPLFDRIFKTVLKPWYGQPRFENLKLWESHNPLEPFFSNIIEDAEKMLGISADQEKLDCPPLGRSIINPYWFLKYEWPKRLNESRLWYSSICHGDLNMQNILLDETDNIYIIDFSETHIRNIVSDFARLEPIFKIEMTRNNSDSDLRDKIMMEEVLTGITKLNDKPVNEYKGDDPMIKKAFEMVLKVREYARMCQIFEEDPIPYWLAVLEWTLPYVSYQGIPVQMQLHSAYSSGLIIERIVQKA